MTPNDIEVLIHYHCSPTVHPRIEAGAVKNALRWLLLSGIIEQEPETSLENRYCTTDKGKALMKLLCDTLIPVQAWVDDQGNVIEI